MVEIKVDTLEFKKGLDSASKELEDLMYERIKNVSSFLKTKTVKEAPTDTGLLKSSIFGRSYRIKGELKTVIGSNSEYAVYVHQGTGIHAKEGNGRKKPWKVTTIYKGRKITFWTTGQKPNPFLTRARDKNIGNIKRLLGVD